MDNTLKIYTDGGSRGNPGPAASAFVVISNSKVVYESSQFLGSKTNNYAEYSGLLEAVKWIVSNHFTMKYKEIVFLMDSQLIIRQINKLYKIKNKDLIIISSEIFGLLEKLPIKYYFQYIPRENNRLSDYLVNKCLNENISYFTLQS